ncbi:MAG TPA: helix-turn-helix transcriptional regulator [Caulobacteraceae bacterium]|jgi:transcriptional regulator with XRE-family HTH domain|nr:helix-turn-helix transcriptional regulator [Caulobacteraceae bacterium]
MDTSEGTLRKWEDGRNPLATAYPKIIEFLGCEPWPEPKTLAERIRAARWRRGMRIQDAAKLLDVDASTFWWWEAGRKPHRLNDRARVAEFVTVPTVAPANQGLAPEDEGFPGQIADIGAMVRRRRMELGLTLESAAKLMGANPWTVLHWEHNHHAPACRFFPSLIRFLGREPWPEPTTIAARLRAERLRRGLSCDQVAGLLQIDDGSVNAWECGDGPHHGIAKAKVEAFLTGTMRPWQRRGRARYRKVP